jgi:AcrR family transcriptional regulator
MPEATQALVDAVMDLINEGATLSSLSLVSIAHRAGVSRNSLYRRWRSKAELYVEVTHSMFRITPDFTAHSAREHLTKLLEMTLERSIDLRMRGMDRAIIAESQRFPEVFEVYIDQIIEPRRRAMRGAIRRGKETGEIRFDVDEDLLSEVLVSPLIAQTFTGSAEELDSETASRRITDLVFDGVSPN